MKAETEAWLKKATEDLETAKDCMKIRRFSAAAFYSQQAAEKALKAKQIQMLGRFDRIHDLLALGISLKAPKYVMQCCIKLTPYYTITRYPDIDQPVTERTANELISKSNRVLKWVKRSLK